MYTLHVQKGKVLLWLAQEIAFLKVFVFHVLFQQLKGCVLGSIYFIQSLFFVSLQDGTRPKLYSDVDLALLATDAYCEGFRCG